MPIKLDPVSVFVFETRCVARAGLELVMETRKPVSHNQPPTSVSGVLGNCNFLNWKKSN